MRECRSCINRHYKDELLCCKVNHLLDDMRKLLRKVPLIGKYIPPCKCGNYMMDEEFSPFPDHVNCRCTFNYPEIKERE